MKTLQDIIEETGYKTTAYSGRGMYGKYCLGYSAENISRSLVEIGEQISNIDSKNEKNKLYKMLSNSKYDSLGLNYIVYFPQIEYKESV